MVRPRLIDAWEENLAFRGSSVEVWEDGHQTRRGILAGLTQEGALRLLDDGNKESIIHFGEMHLRPANLQNASSEENTDQIFSLGFLLSKCITLNQLSSEVKRETPGIINLGLN